MPEPTVQVPVSLIERLLRESYDLFPVGTFWTTLDELVELSQPTPTAERHHPTCGALDEPCHCAERGDAVPPRIEDMAPGTTFRARILGQIEDDLWFRTALGVTSATGVRAELWHIDPSTIRDVQEPKVAAA